MGEEINSIKMNISSTTDNIQPRIYYNYTFRAFYRIKNKPSIPINLNFQV